MLKFHPLTVTDVRPDAEDAVAIAIDVPEALRDTYRGLPGQHVVVRTHIDGEELRRTYSPVSAPGESPLRIVARIAPKGRLSGWLAQGLRAGDTLEVLPPNGSFTPRAAGGAPGTFVAFAAGSGITPVLSIAAALLAGGHRVIVFYGNTDTTRTMCLEELMALKDRYLGRLALHFVMSREPQESELYNGRLEPGRVREFARTLFDPTAVTEYFLCGPGEMNEGIAATLRELGVPAERIHGEHFRVQAAPAGEAPGAVQDPGTAALRAGAALAEEAPLAPGEAQVTLLMDGRRRSFRMRMGDEAVLDAAARAGIELPFSCRAGVCSTCRTKVVRGEVEMAQNYALEDWELAAGYVLACQSRVKTPVLELDYDEK